MGLSAALHSYLIALAWRREQGGVQLAWSIVILLTAAGDACAALLHPMVSVLLAERVPADGRVLVLGAVGGLELKALAQMHPAGRCAGTDASDWSFDDVDPSQDMLALARQTVGPLAERIQFHHGIVESAPEAPFDEATCLLTFHFIDRTQRLATLLELHRRLRCRAPLLMAHMGCPQSEPERAR